MKKITLSLLALSLAAIQTHAETVQQVTNNSDSNRHWNQSATWGQTPVADNDYVTGSGFTLRTTGSTSSTFGGGSLTIANGGIFQMRQGEGNTATVNRLILQGGSAIQQLSEGVTNLAGTQLQIDPGKTSITIGNTRGIALDFAELSGSGTLEFQRTSGQPLSTSSIRIGNARNFTGTLSVVFGNLDFVASGTGNYSASTLAVVANSFSTATITLSRDISLSALTIDGAPGGISVFTPGSYSSLQLNTLIGKDVFNGTGTLTIIPEPSTMSVSAVIVISSMAMLHLRRRQQAK